MRQKQIDFVYDYILLAREVAILHRLFANKQNVYNIFDLKCYPHNLRKSFTQNLWTQSESERIRANQSTLREQLHNFKLTISYVELLRVSFSFPRSVTSNQRLMLQYLQNQFYAYLQNHAWCQTKLNNKSYYKLVALF